MTTSTCAEPATIREPRSAFDWTQAAALLHDYVEWLRAAVGVEPLDEQPALRAELDDLSRVYDGVRARLVIAVDGDLAVGTAALRHHPDGTAELKRMYLRPVARGRGLADELLGRVVDDAVRDGARSIWLETMRGVMEPALAVYRRHGFEPARTAGRTIALDGMVVLERSLPPVS